MSLSIASRSVGEITVLTCTGRIVDGDEATTLESFVRKLSKTNRTSRRQKNVLLSQQKDWPRTNQWVQRAVAAGSNSAQLNQPTPGLWQGTKRRLLPARGGLRRRGVAVSAAEQAGGKPAEADRCAWPMPRGAPAMPPGQKHAEKLSPTTRTRKTGPPPQHGCRASPASRPLALDVMRLKLANGYDHHHRRVHGVAQLALQAGLPTRRRPSSTRASPPARWAPAPRPSATAPARPGAQAAGREQRRARQGVAEAAAAKDGKSWSRSARSTPRWARHDKGIGLIEQGIARGGLKRPDDAKLRLGWQHVGQDQAKGRKRCAACGAATAPRHRPPVGGVRAPVAARARRPVLPALRRAPWATASPRSTPASCGRASTPPT